MVSIRSKDLLKGLGFYIAVGLFVGLPIKLLPRKEAFGVEKESGISTHLRQRWTVIGSISPQKTASGVAVLLDATSGKTHVFRIGDILPGTDQFQLVSVNDQKVLVSDGDSRVILDHLETTAKTPEKESDGFYTPLSALESYYQNLDQNRFPAGESYEELMDRLPDLSRPQGLTREEVLGPSRFPASTDEGAKSKPPDILDSPDIPEIPEIPEVVSKSGPVLKSQEAESEADRLWGRDITSPPLVEKGSVLVPGEPLPNEIDETRAQDLP